MGPISIIAMVIMGVLTLAILLSIMVTMPMDHDGDQVKKGFWTRYIPTMLTIMAYGWAATGLTIFIDIKNLPPWCIMVGPFAALMMAARLLRRNPLRIGE